MIEEQRFGEADRLFWIYTEEIRNDNGVRRRRPAGKVKTSKAIWTFYLRRIRRYLFQRFFGNLLDQHRK